MKGDLRRTLTSEVDDGDARSHDAYESVAEQARDYHGEKSDDRLYNRQLKVVLEVQLYEGPNQPFVKSTWTEGGVNT